MILFLALLGVAFAGNDESKCALNFLNGDTDDYASCDMDSEIDSLISQSQTCWKALGKCQGGGGGGGTVAPMGLIVKYGDEQFGFGLSAMFPLGACFDEIHARALEYFTSMDDDHELVFDYANANPKVSGKVRNDADLEVALLTAQRMNFHLTLTAHKTTISPTPHPTETWGAMRYVRQVAGNVEDGRDSGMPGVTKNTQRKVKILKTSGKTQLRLHYEDNLRVYNNGGVCYWELYLEGKRVKGTDSNIIRGGMHSQGNDNNDHQTCTIIGVTSSVEKYLYPAGEITFSVQISGNNRDCHTGWDGEVQDGESKGFFMLEAKEVMQGRYSYLAWRSQYQPARGEDNAFPIVDRVLEFTKVNDNTALRLLYADNFRVYNGGHCRWYLRVDKNICKDGKNLMYIANSVHTNASENDHVPGAFMGYCLGISKGKHTLKAGVQSGGNHDCYTGWESNFYLEVREIAVEKLEGNTFNKDKEIGSGIYYYHRAGNNVDGRDNGYVNWRVLKFDKYLDKDSSHLRLTYSDNLRVHGHGKWCKWELHIDGKPCAQNISGNKYVVRNQNDHSSQMIIGYCTGITKGRHEMKVFVKGNSADCYTGWDRQSQGSFVLETEELKAGSVKAEFLEKEKSG